MSQNKINLHILAVPHAITSRVDNMICCAFTQTIVNFAKGMKKLTDYNLIHYGHEDTDINLFHEHVTVNNNDDFKKSGYFDKDFTKQSYVWSEEHQAYKSFIKNSVEEIKNRAKKDDFVLMLGGFHYWVMRGIEHLPVTIVDFSVGHRFVYTDYAVYVTHAHMQAMYGKHHADYVNYKQANDHFNSLKGKNYKVIDIDNRTSYDWDDIVEDIRKGIQCTYNYRSHQEALDIPRWGDAVIPIPVDPNDFHYRDETEKENYFLYCARLNYSKGIEIAVKVAQRLDTKLIMAGQNNPEWGLGYKLPKQVEYLGGSVGPEKRKDLMSKAKLMFAPTLLNEPGPTVVYEGGLSGTPIVSTDWGGFTNNVIHGVTGYRCRSFEQFVWAAKNIGNIKSKNCREFAMQATYDNVATRYDEYFKNILRHRKHGIKTNTVHSDRMKKEFWYDNPDRTDLNWLNQNVSKNN